MTFAVRHIDVQFDLGEESFKAVGSRSVTVTGLRVSASIQQSGLPSNGMAQVRIWGMPLKLMNQLSRLGKPISYVRDNTITVLASSGNDAMTKVFAGTMFSSYGDFSDPPNASLNVSALAAGVAGVKPVTPISIKGPVDVGAVMNQIAQSMNKQFLNRGVSVQLPTSYLTGSAVDQMKAVARAANINADVDDLTLTIWPKDGSRDADGAPHVLISPQTGMIGYPQYTDGGATFRALYQPGVAFGSTIKVESSLEPAAGEWISYGVKVELESELPGGKWFMDIDARRKVGGA